ncbi:diacylglycerol/lipid kinase family protein [Propionibacterium cyclohexanicum]|uniref:diacylglycerol/lipid kinase family protein n=1 Tax=Propionibacterium cyclohexanicum TaxID=64702 RepID=UPI0015A67EE4|nr:diacylglycerol kinase family protein [Propionibacterium cyclohexanicum]
MTLLVNPAAGHGVAHLMAPRIARRVAAALPDSQLRVVVSTSPADARALAQEAVEKGEYPREAGRRPDVLCVVGGDGTASVGFNACAGSSTQLAVIPVGTGNDFVRGVGAPRRPDHAVAALIAGHTRRIDLLVARGALAGDRHEKRVGSVVSTGYDAEVNLRVNDSAFDLGKLSYAWAVFSQARRFHPRHYAIRLDSGPVREVEAMIVAVGNAGYIGGGIRICPQADPTDGLLDVTLVRPVGLRTLVRLFPQLYSGNFTRIDEAETYRVRSVHLDGDWPCATADGETLGPAALDLGVDPGCVEIIVASAPRKAAGSGR